MSAVPQNPLNPPVFEIPDPPHEFGQDGGKFYRHYDGLAQEIDDDMTSGLKEQLDGMLIFAGLFAGVNTAFLGLTIPLLSADPADDTNALLNAILTQLATGRNDSLPTDSILPSAAFSPSHDIFTINALFSLSLAFAIISSFLAVLGRQWLVYYRKRGGGGPDRQRWEQLKRFLGAERWKLEPILDDVLPSLLQIGLIIFCASLILYLRHLSPAISIIVGMPLYVGLAFFVGSALCTIWDRFCPFQSPLSHLLLGASHSLSWIKASFTSFRKRPPTSIGRRAQPPPRPLKRIKGKVFGMVGQARLLTAAVFRILYSGRSEETLELLQVIALQRVICISDDRVALLNAIANIFSIRSTAAMERLWNEPALCLRFYELFRNSYKDLLQLRNHGVNPRDMAESARRLYCGAVTHIALTLDNPSLILNELHREIDSLRMETNLIPSGLLLDTSSDLIGATLASGFIRFLEYPAWMDYPGAQTIRNHMTAYSSAIAKCSNHRCLSIFSWAILQLRDLTNRIGRRSIKALAEAYRGETNQFLETLNEAFQTLMEPESRDEFDCDLLLTNILRCVEHLVTDERTHLVSSMKHNFELLKSCERAFRSPQCPEEARQLGRKLRIDVMEYWAREYDAQSNHPEFQSGFIDALEFYLSHLGNLDRTKFTLRDDIEVLGLVNSLVMKIEDVFGVNWEKWLAVQQALDGFVAAVSEVSRQKQNNSRQLWDPDQCWCHWQEEPPSIETCFGVPEDIRAFFALPETNSQRHTPGNIASN